MPNIKIVSQNHVGLTFNRLTVLREFMVRVANRPTRMWECVCICGTIKTIRSEHIKREKIRSCGCLQREQRVKHGMVQMPEYSIWQSMKRRVLNSRCGSYKNYGGRGITVCERWKTSFPNFIHDMQERPTPKHTLERRNNNLGYSPENCYWATRTEQNQNLRRNAYITHNGLTLCITEWARRLGMSYHTIRNRRDVGYPSEVILNPAPLPIGRPKLRTRKPLS